MMMMVMMMIFTLNLEKLIVGEYGFVCCGFC